MHTTTTRLPENTDGVGHPERRPAPGDGRRRTVPARPVAPTTAPPASGDPLETGGAAATGTGGRGPPYAGVNS
jgi:hypothetical protein